MTLDEWIVNGCTGGSSKTIWAALKGVNIIYPRRPYDIADFGRCYDLIEQCNVSSEQLCAVSEMHPFLAPFIDSWSELAESYKSGEKEEFWGLFLPLANASDTIRTAGANKQ